MQAMGRAARGLAAVCLFISHNAAWAESASKTVQVTATILPRLELSVTPETGSAITFGAIEQPAAGETADRSVRVAVGVFSNLGHPYHVTQLVRRGLTNREGAVISDDQFRVMTHDARLGSTTAVQPTPITPGTPSTLYLSNTQGKSDNFLADYTLTVAPATVAGDYDTEIVYTVTSL